MGVIAHGAGGVRRELLRIPLQIVEPDDCPSFDEDEPRTGEPAPSAR